MESFCLIALPRALDRYKTAFWPTTKTGHHMNLKRKPLVTFLIISLWDPKILWWCWPWWCSSLNNGGFVCGHRDSQCLRGSWVRTGLTVKSSLGVPGLEFWAKPASVSSSQGLTPVKKEAVNDWYPLWFWSVPNGRQHCRLSICSYFGWVWQIQNLRRAGLSTKWWTMVTVKVISSENRGSSCEKSNGGPKLGAKYFLQILTFQRSDLDHRPQRRFSAWAIHPVADYCKYSLASTHPVQITPIW